MSSKSNKKSNRQESVKQETTKTVDDTALDTQSTAEFLPTETPEANVQNGDSLPEKAKAGVYISQYNIPHHADNSRIFPGGGTSFEITKNDLKDSWICMQIEAGVFTELAQ